MGLRLLVVSFLGASASFGLTNQNPCAHPDNSVMGMSALERAHGGALPIAFSRVSFFAARLVIDGATALRSVWSLMMLFN